VVVEPRGSFATSGEPRIVTEIPGSTLPTAVMFRDSFTSWLAPFISEHFSRIVYLWQKDFDANVIRSEKPEVVIQEMVSRHLYLYTPSADLIPEIEN
jgi:alginate O-acetyltransferase complex protein AlgJ